MMRLLQRYAYFGYRKLYELMRAKAIAISRVRVRLIRRRERLQAVRKRKKRKILRQTRL